VVEPIDPDLDQDDEAPAQASLVHVGSGLSVDTLLAIAVGGGLGGLARYGLQTALPTQAAGFPWATFIVNVSGCFLLGVLMVLVTEGRNLGRFRYARPFLGVGFLGGFTTFSTYTAQTRELVAAGHASTAGFYLVGSIVVGLTAAAAGLGITRVLLR